MPRITVLGAGLVGAFVARTLAEDGLDVTAVDRSEAALGALAGVPKLKTRRADLSSASAIAECVADADAVAGAVPGFLGHAMLKTVLERGKKISDISFAPEDPLVLDGLAKAKGACAIVDCGVSPGLSNLACGRAAARFDALDSVVISVGGLPTKPVPPWDYRAVFSPTDVLEEYTRPARIVADGKAVTKPALSDVAPFDVPGLGTLEGFLSDGLRTVLSTVKAKNLCERTLRWPGHAEKMRLLREAGFFREEKLDVDGVRVSPRALTEALLFPQWKRGKGEEEFTVLRIESMGTRGGAGRRLVHGLLDRTDPKTGATSMARTTGYPCVIGVHLLLEGAFAAPGVHPPETLGRQPRLFDAFVSDLARRGIAFTEEETAWPR
jgi:saccharopine dehydrogenase-like NADP-dependent oxidoreductase